MSVLCSIILLSQPEKETKKFRNINAISLLNKLSIPKSPGNSGSQNKEDQIEKLEYEKQLARKQRNLIFFYFLTFAGISFTISLTFFLRAKRNKQLFAKELEVESQMTRFFQNISYELRTPLSLIIGPIDVLSENANEDDKNLLKIAQNNTKKLLYLMNQLLDIFKVDAKNLKINASRNDIVPMFKGIFYSFKNYAELKNILLDYSASFNSYKLYYDPDIIEKIVANLVTNALKFTPENGQVSLSLREELLSGKQYFTFEIKDTGVGIDHDNLSNIFNRYYHVGKSKDNSWQGTGIGLALVKELVELISGKIEVHSELCIGTSFKVSLPVGREHLSEEQITLLNKEHKEIYDHETFIEFSETKNENALQEIQDKRVVLLIDDSDEMRQYLRKVLSKDYFIIESSDGQSGIRKAKKYLPSIIICDIIMPKMSGLELCSQLKFDEDTNHIPIVLLTAKSTVEDKIIGLENHADSLLTKPFKVQELKAIINNLITIREQIIKKYSNSNIFSSSSNSVPLISMDQDFIQKVYSFIEENIADENFGVEQLSKHIGLSRSQFQRKLKQILKQNPNQLIRDYRLERAIELIRNNVGTISEVAFRVGFSSPSYFTKCFVEKYGYTPQKIMHRQEIE